MFNDFAVELISGVFGIGVSSSLLQSCFFCYMFGLYKFICFFSLWSDHSPHLLLKQVQIVLHSFSECFPVVVFNLLLKLSSHFEFIDVVRIFQGFLMFCDLSKLSFFLFNFFTKPLCSIYFSIWRSNVPGAKSFYGCVFNICL